MKDSVLIYGSYGYTGRLIVTEAIRNGLPVLLGGRDRQKLRAQSEETGPLFESFELTEGKKLRQMLDRCRLVIHCAGPFSCTAMVMAQACLDTDTHYTDITGEFRVFEALAALDARAREKGIMILPGTGFDVVPSDCLALHLKNRLADATHLQLAFSSLGAGVSRGTARTSLESLGKGGWIRQDGNLVRIPLGTKEVSADFGPFTARAICIPWGDIATAWRSTGIPNIEVYLAMKEKTIRKLKLTRYMQWVFNIPGILPLLRRGIDKRPAGPTAERRAGARAYFWGKVANASGAARISRLETPDGYTLTALTSVLIARKVLDEKFKPGFQTPATAYGEGLILEVEGVSRQDCLTS